MHSNYQHSGFSSQPPLRFLAGYRLLRILGQGGMSEVYLGYDSQSARHVAIKLLAEDLAGDRTQLGRFAREAHLVTTLMHRNIVQGLNAGADEETGRHFLVMEYIDGPSAQDCVEQIGRMKVKDVVHIGLAVAQALEYLHCRNYIHRDIKPSNILLAPDGHARLTDLGLVKWADRAAEQLTATNDGFGTSYYMPLEQALNAHFVDARSDIFALGATLYHLLTGRVPFPGEDHQDILRMKRAGYYTPVSLWNPRVPTALEAILNRMLAVDPRKRYRSATDVLVALERTQLAHGYPSYRNQRLALRGPKQPEQFMLMDKTRPDLRAGSSVQRKNCVEELWYLRFRDHAGQTVFRKGTTEQVLRSLRKGRFRGMVFAARRRLKNFRPLAEYPEFHAYYAALPPSKPIPVGLPAPKAGWCRRLLGRRS